MDNPDRIIEEVIRLEPDRDRERLKAFAESYRDCADLTIQIQREGKSRDLVVRQLASSGDGNQSRDYKEACRRAFARLVIEEMHRSRMEISFIVA